MRYVSARLTLATMDYELWLRRYGGVIRRHRKDAGERYDDIMQMLTESASGEVTLPAAQPAKVAAAAARRIPKVKTSKA